MTPPNSTSSPARRVLRVLGRVFRWVAVLLLVALAGTFVAARVLHRRDAERWKAPGQLVALDGGRRLHLYCMGQGTPTVILEAGLGDFGWSAWGRVQPQMATQTRTCSYDRAGTGWSDPPAGAPTADAIVRDLRAMLAASGEPGPYVLVGHSLGGPIIRLFAHRHPAEVAGLVLVDGSHEDQIERLKGMPDPGALLAVVPALHFLGIDRVAASLGGKDTLDAMRAALQTTDKAMANTIAIGRTLPAFMAEVKRESGSHGDLPITALTAGRMPVPGLSADQVAAVQKEWAAMHQELVARTTRGRWILAEQSTHYIQVDQPDLVIGAVREMVDLVRNGSAPPTPSVTSTSR